MKYQYVLKVTVISLLLGMFSAYAFAEGEALQIKTAQGLVQVKKFGANDWAKAQEGGQLVPGDTIRTFLESSALLVYPDGSEFALGENSFLEVKDLSQNPQTKVSKRELKLDLGTLRYKITPLKEKASDFKIHSSTAIVGITGTEGVMVALGQDKPTQNILLEGTTYNTNDEGNAGVIQSASKVYRMDEEAVALFNSDVSEDSQKEERIDPQALAEVKRLVAEYEGKKNQGYIVGPVSGIIENCFAYLENRDYTFLNKSLAQGFAVLEKASVPKRLQTAFAQIDTVREEIAAKEKEGYDLQAVYVLFEKLQEGYQAGSLANIDNTITLINQKMGSLSKDEGNFIARYQALEEQVLARQMKGFEASEINEMLRRSYLFYENQDVAAAYRLLKRAQAQLQLTYKELPTYLEDQINKLADAVAAKKNEGFAVQTLELQVAAAEKWFHDGAYLRVKEILASAQDELLILKRKVPVEWEAKLAALKETIANKKSLGFDVSSLSTYTRTIDQSKEAGDMEKLTQAYGQARQALAALTLPAGFAMKWKQFNVAYQEKKEQGYSLQAVDEFKSKVEAALEKEDINIARTFLVSAQGKLDALKDVTPPMVQIVESGQEKGIVSITGVASDTIKVKNVFVNGSLVDFDARGQFSYQTVASSLLEAVTVVASDISGNQSAPITIAVEGSDRDDKGTIKKVILKPVGDQLLVNGIFIPGGKVAVEETIAFCDQAGRFSVPLVPTAELIKKGVTIQGWNLDGSLAKEVATQCVDTWKPQIFIEKVLLQDTVAPSLSAAPIVYQGEKAVVKGNASERILVTLEGRVTDLGEGEVTCQVRGKEVSLDEQGHFSVSVSLGAGEQEILVAAADSAGNSTRMNVPADFVLDVPQVAVNGQTVVLNAQGEFTYDIALTRELKEIIVTAWDSKGNEASPVKLFVAGVIPPELEISQIVYEKEHAVVWGKTASGAVVTDSKKAIIADSVTAGADGLFKVQIARPKERIEGVFIATDLEGNASSSVPVVVEPLVDRTPPHIYLAQPNVMGKKVVIAGFVDDDTQVVSVHINGESVAFPEGRFNETLAVRDLDMVEVVAQDISGKSKRAVAVIRDTQKPQIEVSQIEVTGGVLHITGKAVDNLALKEVRLNGLPVAQGQNPELDFDIQRIMTPDLKEVTLLAIDQYGNTTQEGPLRVEVPQDSMPPTLEVAPIRYGSPRLFVSGKVDDPAGVEAVFVNGEKVDVNGDGTWEAKVEIDVLSPELAVETPSYEEGKVIVAGQVKEGGFNPDQIVAEAQDLWGNRTQIMAQKVEPYTRDEITVLVDGELATVDAQGRFSHELVLEGATAIVVNADDPFGNATAQTVEFERTQPRLEVSDLEYLRDQESVRVSGTASDSESGLASLRINGKEISVDASGDFSDTFSFAEERLTVVAVDYVGNVTSVTKEVTPPDMWPPVFTLEIKPVPAVVGVPVEIAITSTDSRSGIPELLSQNPRAWVLADGKQFDLAVDGSGSQFYATVDTSALTPGVVTVGVSGQDMAGNRSETIEGQDTFTLVTSDSIAPSFTIAGENVILGKEATIRVHSSEALAVTPEMEVVLTNGESKVLPLTKEGALELSAKLGLGLDLPLGEIVVTLRGGQDFAGNDHDQTQARLALSAPSAAKGVPLTIEAIDFIAEKLMVRGQTASKAVVTVEFFSFVRDIVADEQGRFTYQQQITYADLEKMYEQGPSIGVAMKAKTYAGLQSRQKVIEVTLPPLPSRGGTYFSIAFNPPLVEQGGLLEVEVELLQRVREEVKGMIYLPDGTRVPVELQGRKSLTGQYQVPEDAPLGRAMLEVVAGTIRESRDFEIGLSAGWMQKLDKEGFYTIRALPDPMLKGKRAEFIVTAAAALTEPPTMNIVLPSGREVAVSLSGSETEFRGEYLCPSDIPSGPAEIILNPGTGDEVRRPFGVEDESRAGEVIDVFLGTNPEPLVVDTEFEVFVNFSRPVDFPCTLSLRFSDGAKIDVPLQGSAPTQMFRGNARVPATAPTGLANFTLQDDQGATLDTFGVQVVSGVGSRRGVEIFVFPDVLARGDIATVQLNSLRALSFVPKAHVMFADSRKVIFDLNGADRTYKGEFTVPKDVPEGMVSIEVFDDQGRTMGSVQAQVGGSQDTGSVGVFLDPENFGPGDQTRLSVDAPHPLFFLPQARLVWDGGSLDVRLQGAVPGNRFQGGFVAPTGDLRNLKVEIRDDNDRVITEYFIERGTAGHGRIIIEPMPPQVGQPLVIKVQAPGSVSDYPTARLGYEQGVEEVKLYGPLPGTSFSATISQLAAALQFVEILDPSGNVVAHMPMEVLGAGPLDFTLEASPWFRAGQTVNLVVRGQGPIPFVPFLRLDFEGKIVDVPLMGVPGAREFLGRAMIPSDVSTKNIKAFIFDPQGQLVWQRMLSGGSDTGSALGLSATPVGSDGVDLSWDRVGGASAYELRYDDGKDGKGKVQITETVYSLKGLISGNTYSFQVGALDSRGQEIVTSPIIEVVCGQTQQELFVQDIFDPFQKSVHLIWGDYPGAEQFLVAWGTAPGSYAQETEIKEKNYTVGNLVLNKEYYIKVYALRNGIVVGESREIVVFLSDTAPAGGEIYVNPDPPEKGKDVVIDVHLFQDYPANEYPHIRVELDKGIVENPQVSGSKRDFKATLSGDLFKEEMLLVVVEDGQGRIIAERPFGGAHQDGHSAISVAPYPPQEGKSFEVFADIPFDVPLAPKGRLLYVDGSSEDFDFTGRTPGRHFSAAFSRLTKALRAIVLLDPQGVEQDRFEFSDSDRRSGVEILVNPFPPQVDQNMTIKLNFADPVTFKPKILVYFAGGKVSEYGVLQDPGTAGRTSFDAIVAAAEMKDPVDKIVVQDDKGEFLGEIFIANSGNRVDLEIYVDTDPPQKGKDLGIKVVFKEDPSFKGEPRIIAALRDGPLELRVVGLGKEFKAKLPADKYTSDLMLIIVEDPDRKFLGERPFAGGHNRVNLEILAVPDPPEEGKDVEVKVLFEEDPGYTKAIRIIADLKNGPVRLDVEGKGKEYKGKLSGDRYTSELMRITVEDSDGAFLGDRPFSGGGRHDVAVVVDPFPPKAGDRAKIEVFIDRDVTKAPRARVTYDDKSKEELALEGKTPGREFYVYISKVKRPMELLEILDPEGQVVESIDLTQPPITFEISSDPDPAKKAEELTVKLAASEDVFFQPQAVLLFKNGDKKVVAFQDPGTTGRKTFDSKVAATDMVDDLDKIIIEDDRGNFMEEKVFSSSGGSCDSFKTTLSSPKSGEIDVRWTAFDGAGAYAVKYGTASGSYTADGSPVTASRDSTSLLLANLTGGKTYYVVVEALDANNVHLCETAEVSYVLDSDLDPVKNIWIDRDDVAGEVTLGWDAVSDAAGYYIYHSTTSRGYNDTDRTEVEGGNSTRGTVTSLTDGTEYFFTVRPYDDNKEVGPESAREVSTTPGGGDLVINPYQLDFTDITFGQDTAAQNITITNNASTNQVVTVLVDDLEDLAGNSIDASNIKIDNSFTVSANSSVTKAVYISVPSTNVAVSNYHSDLQIFIDADQDGVFDYNEVGAWVGIMMKVGAGGLDVIPEYGFVGENNPGDTTEYFNFQIKNESDTTNYANLTVEAVDMRQMDGGSSTIASSNVDYTVPSSIAKSATGNCKVRVNIPAGQAAGEYVSSLTIYNDADDDGTRDIDENAGSFFYMLRVVDEGVSLTVTNGPTINFGSAEAGTKPGKTVSMSNNTGTDFSNVRFDIHDLMSASNKRIASSGIITPSAFSLSAGNSIDKTLEIDILATQDLDSYQGILTVYVDANNNGFQDMSEPYDTLDIQVMVTAAAGGDLDIEDSDPFNLGLADPGATASADLTIKNNSTGNFTDNIRVIKNDLTLSGSSTTIASDQITIVTPFSVNAGQSISKSVSVDVPFAQADGVYQGTLRIYADLDGDSQQDGDEPYDDVTLKVTVNKDEANSLTVTETLVDFGSLSPDAMETKTITMTNNTTSIPFGSVNVDCGTFTGDTPTNTIVGTSVTLLDTGALSATEESTRSIKIIVPNDAAADHYGAVLKVYADLDSSGSYTAGEPFDEVSLSLDVSGGGGIEILTASPIDFGECEVGALAMTTIEVKNTSFQPYMAEFIVTDLSSGTHVLPASDIRVLSIGPIPVNSSASGGISINVNSYPAQPGGVYEGTLQVFADTPPNENQQYDDGEPIASIDLKITVKRQPIDSITTISGEGGTVDLSWIDTNPETDHYEVFWSTGTINYDTPNATVRQKMYVADSSALSPETTYYFAVRSVGADGFKDTGTTTVSATTGAASQSDGVKPTFEGIERAYSNGQTGQIVLAWNQASDASLPVTYDIYRGGAPSHAAMTLVEAGFSGTEYLVSGLANGQLFYFEVIAKDSADPANYSDSDQRFASAQAGAIDEIAISGRTSSTVGEPVLIRLAAMQGTSVATDFSDSIVVTAWSDTASVDETILLSVQDRMTGKVGEVEMVAGEGYFTVDCQEPGIVKVSVQGIPSSPSELSIDFAAPAGGAIKSFAIQGPATANTGTTGEDGALIWVSAIDEDGKVATSYNGLMEITISGGELSVVDGDGQLTSGQYTFAASDNGEVLFRLKDANAETVTMSVAEGSATSNSYSVEFLGVDTYYIFSGYSFDSGEYDVVGRRIRFTVYAGNTETESRVSGYSGQATVTVKAETYDNDSAYASPSSLEFVDGVAEFYLENSGDENEKVKFEISDGTSSSGEYVVDFNLTGDADGPELLDVVCETPYLLHLYFSEDIDDATALEESNYTAPATISKICWYEDNVTIHLASVLPLGDTQTLTVKGYGSGGTIKDKNGNPMQEDAVRSFTVPEVDYQGQPNPGNDWYEIQLSQYTVPAGTPTEVTVTVYHKNACGYMTGSNRANIGVNPDSSTTVQLGVETGSSATGVPGSIDMSSGQASFSMTVTCEPGKKVSLSVFDNNISSIVSPEITGQ